MATTRLRDQGRLDKASNFGVWKAIMQYLLDEHGLKQFVTNVMVEPIGPRRWPKLRGWS